MLMAMTYNITCETCSSFISDDQIAYSNWRSPFSDEFFYLCTDCCFDVDEDDDNYGSWLASAGWGTEEDYGYYGE